MREDNFKMVKIFFATLAQAVLLLVKATTIAEKVVATGTYAGNVPSYCL
jgi:hypothetical protein